MKYGKSKEHGRSLVHALEFEPAKQTSKILLTLLCHSKEVKTPNRTKQTRKVLELLEILKYYAEI